MRTMRFRGEQFKVHHVLCVFFWVILYLQMSVLSKSPLCPLYYRYIVFMEMYKGAILIFFAGAALFWGFFDW